MYSRKGPAGLFPLFHQVNCERHVFRAFSDDDDRFDDRLALYVIQLSV